MIRGVCPEAVADLKAGFVTGWNIAQNIAYTLSIYPGSSSGMVLVFNADQSTLIASGLFVTGTDQPVVLMPQTGQTVGMLDDDLGYHLLVTTTGSESTQTIRYDPFIDGPDQVAAIYSVDELAIVQATAAIFSGTHYTDDVSILCPLGLDGWLGDVVAATVHGESMVGDIESVSFQASPSSMADVVTIRRMSAMMPDAPVVIAQPVVADDVTTTDAATPTSGNVLDNDTSGLTVVAVNGLESNVGIAVAGAAGGVFTIAANGAWTFDPDGDFATLSGSDTAETSVTYHASNGHAETMATLSVTVSAAAVVPVQYLPSSLSPLDKAAAITLSNNNRTATRAAGYNWAVVRSATGKHSGKHYFEVTNVANGLGTGDAMWGFHEGADDLSYYPGNAALTAKSMGWQANNTPNSSKFQDGALGAVIGYGTVAAGQKSFFAIDFDAGKLWVRNSAAAGWAGGGDPVAGTSPTFTFAPNAHLFIAIGAYYGPQSAKVNFGDEAFLGTVPTGFAPGWLAPESLGSALTFDSRITTTGTADAQGVATDGTHVWYSNSTTLFKYTKAGVLVTSRVVSGDAPTDKSQINGLFLKDGVLFVSAAKAASGVLTSWIAQYDPNTLAYISHTQISTTRFSEGIAFKDGYWWVVFHGHKVICRYDTSFNLVTVFPLTYSITGSAGIYGVEPGYDGLAWIGDFMLCNIHEIYNESYTDIYYWNGSGFEEAARIAQPTSQSSQGISTDPSDPAVLWFAERNYSGTDAIVKATLA